MAIDPTGKVTTTGLMNVTPSIPKAPNLKSLGNSQVTPKQVAPRQSVRQPKPQVSPQEEMQMKQQEKNQVAIESLIQQYPGLKNLTAEDNATLDSVLSPSVKNAIGKIVPDLRPLMDMFGGNEPNVVIPLSIASKFAMSKYGGASIEEAIQNFTADLIASSEQNVQPQPMGQTTVPPSPQPQGLMASPQNMENV